MPIRRALVLGGTGMLTKTTAALLADGWHVVVPSRRYAPIPADGTGRLRWVEADWSDPAELARRAARALGGAADLAVAWVEGRARASVLAAIEPLLAEDAPVIEVHGTGSAGALAGCPDPAIPHHPTQQVVLCAITEHGHSRWLTQDEISTSIQDAIRRALAGRPPATHQIGGLRVS